MARCSNPVDKDSTFPLVHGLCKSNILKLPSGTDHTPQFTVKLSDLLSTKQMTEGLSSKEHYLLLSHLDTLNLFHRVRPRMKRAKDGLLPMLFLPRL